MKFYNGLGTKVKKLFVQSPAKKQGVIGENPDVDSKVASKNFDFGSKEETFFDSQAWLDSDCDDDFHSVNGEFTPSRGSTPNYQTHIRSTPSLNKALFTEKFVEAKSESSSSTTSPGSRKKLSELFQETFRGNVNDGYNDTNGNTEAAGKSHLPPKSVNGTPYISGASSVCGSEMTPNGDSNMKKKRRMRAMSCCLPSLVHSFSFNERRQKMSPRSA